MGTPDEIATAIRQIARGLETLADAIVGERRQGSVGTKELAILREWGERGLTRAQASAVFRKHGLAPQTAGGWARGDWIETRQDGRRYLTERSRSWLAEQPEENEDG